MRNYVEKNSWTSTIFFFILLFFLSNTLYAREKGPWLPSLLEFQSSLGYHYAHTEKVESPLGSFAYRNDYNTLFATIELPLLPGFSVASYLGFVQSNTLPLSYEQYACLLRRQWFDDLCEAPFTMTTTLSLAFPPRRLLHDFNYPFHGSINGEADLALGKECLWGRYWILGGYGVAERGSPWIRGKIAIERDFSSHSTALFFIESLYGLGGDNIEPNLPFGGYRRIQHQTIDLGFNFDYECLPHATFSFSVYSIVYARNFIENGYGGQIELTLPFGL